MKKSAYWLLLLFLLVGCNSQKTTKNLNLADSLLSVRSDSALSLLKGMEVKDFSEEDFAYYALLMTQAMHKNYVAFTTDSLIHASVTYYLKMDDSERKAKVMFYQGVDDYLNAKGNLSSSIINDLFELYTEFTLVPSFRKASGYQNYPYDMNRTSLSNFSNLRVLTINC